MFSLELALLKGSKRFDTLKKQLLEIASALEDQTGIPAIAHQAVLIEEIQTDHGGRASPFRCSNWCGCGCAIWSSTSRSRARRSSIPTSPTRSARDGGRTAAGRRGRLRRFKQKARHFLKAHEDHIVLHKLRQGKPLTATDLGELEKMLLDAGIGEAGISSARARQAKASAASCARWSGSTARR